MTSELARAIRDVPDFPKPGILYKDITPLLQDAHLCRLAIDLLVARVRHLAVDRVVAMESRGFIFGAPVAYLLGVGFVPVRKLGKLPAAVVSVAYELEYASATLEMHRDAIAPGERILIVDDLLATGGTVAATVQLVEKLGGQVAGLAFLIELASLGGRARLAGHEVVSVLTL